MPDTRGFFRRSARKWPRRGSRRRICASSVSRASRQARGGSIGSRPCGDTGCRRRGRRRRDRRRCRSFRTRILHGRDGRAGAGRNAVNRAGRWLAVRVRGNRRTVRGRYPVRTPRQHRRAERRRVACADGRRHGGNPEQRARCSYGRAGSGAAARGVGLGANRGLTALPDQPCRISPG